MKQHVIQHHIKLLGLTKMKLEILSGIQQNYMDIKENEIFAQELDDAYMELFEKESSLVNETAITIQCPECGFECAQIYSYCMVCGKNLHSDDQGETM